MNFLKTAWEEIYGLFVDDGTLAIGILLWIAAAAFLFPRLGGDKWKAPLFFLGLFLLLVENVRRSAKNS